MFTSELPNPTVLYIVFRTILNVTEIKNKTQD